jgi:pimeloyl-ACP methyl ester carboxylesterase
MRPASVRESTGSTASFLSDSLHVTSWGDRGHLVVMVHGSFTWGEDTWAQQRDLSDNYRLLVVDRCGHGESPDTKRIRFEEQADDIADLLGTSAHLVGSSYGALLALVVAQRDVGKIRSLTVIEPPAWGLARGDPLVDEQVLQMRPVLDQAEQLGPDLAFSRFLEAIGAEPMGGPLTETDRKNTVASFREQPPEEAPLSLEGLRAMHLPLLIVSGGVAAATSRLRNRRLAFHRACETLATIPGAEWAQFPSAGHNPHLEDPGFNPRLRSFLDGVGRS